MELRDYEEGGGIQGALDLHAKAAWEKLEKNPRQAEIARRLFLSLCEVAPDGQIVRRRPKVSEILLLTGARPEDLKGPRLPELLRELKEVIHAFQEDDRNFLLPEDIRDLQPEDHLDISHEALLRQWKLFNGDWLMRERIDVAELRRLADRSRSNQEGGSWLSKAEFGRAKSWLGRVSAPWALRYEPSEQVWKDIQDFIEKSEKAIQESERSRENMQKTRQRMLMAFGMVIIAMAGLAVSFFYFRKSQSAEKELRMVLAQLYISGQGEPWGLATNRSVSFRSQVLRGWLTNALAIEHCLQREGTRLHAAIGLHEELHAQFLEGARQLARDLVANVSNPVTGSERMAAEGSILANLLTHLPLAEAQRYAREVGETLVAKLQEQQTKFNELRPKETIHRGPSELEQRSPLALSAPAASKDESASEAGKRAVNAPPNSPGLPTADGADGLDSSVRSTLEFHAQLDKEGGRLAEIADAIVHLLPRMESVTAAKLANQTATLLTQVLESPQATNELDSLGRINRELAELSTHLDTESRAVLARGLVGRIVRQEESDSSPPIVESDRLESLIHNLDPEDLRQLAEPLVNRMVDPEGIEEPIPEVWVRLVRLLATNLNSTAASPLARQLGTALDQAPDDSPRVLPMAQALISLTGQLNGPDAAPLAIQWVPRIEHPSTNEDRIPWPEVGLGTLTGDLGTTGEEVAQRLTRIIESQATTESDGERIEDTARAFGPWIQHLSPPVAADIVNRLAALVS